MYNKVGRPIFLFSAFVINVTDTLANAISKYETLLSDLEQSINSKDGLKSRNAILELKKMKTEMPPNLIFKELKDSNKKNEFKYILADFLDYSTKYVSSKVFNVTLDSYIEIIKNPNYNSTIRNI